MASGAMENKCSSFEMLLINYAFFLSFSFSFLVGVVAERCISLFTP